MPDCTCTRAGGLNMAMEHLLYSVITGIIMVFLGYMMYRRPSIALWGWMAGFMPDLPVLIQTPLGVPVWNLFWVMVLSHTLGIIVFTTVLLIIDVLLIEIGLIRYLKPLYLFLPGPLRTAVRLENLIERLQGYSLIPMPERLKSVFVVGMLAGIVHLIINLTVWSL